jgi:catechol 2,3-dioxygenase-like lactoylglutathione lyase family enzyme
LEGQMAQTQQKYDRKVEDIGNIVGLEHVNLRVSNQEPATDFYLAGLGLTRDPYMMAGTNNMWVNVGRSQFHLPKGDPNVLRGHIGLVVPSLDDLCERLNMVKGRLGGSKFDCKRHNAFVEATCPWGNRFRLYEPCAEKFGPVSLGMPYVEFDVPEGTADGIARFYREIFYAPTEIEENGDGRAARVSAGLGQCLVFRETDKKIPEFDGHHLQIYIQEFSGPHEELEKRGLITEESSQYQYRFEDIACLDTGKCLFKIEHEVRSITHPLYNRKLVNRNTKQNLMYYQMGADEWDWWLPREQGRMPAAQPAVEPTTPLARRRAARMAAM